LTIYTPISGGGLAIDGNNCGSIDVFTVASLFHAVQHQGIEVRVALKALNSQLRLSFTFPPNSDVFLDWNASLRTSGVLIGAR
jgi:hypothetical protein